MSNIYIQEPPTSGKVSLETTVGDIEIELWSKECPKACRNFVQLCLEKYYDGTIFHRVVPGFIVQCGDPTGTGFGGESIYGAPFKDEFHSRLRFVRRGLVGMANTKKDDNTSQFFFTLDKTPELQGKHTIFGQLAGDTLYNMLKLAECQVDKNERPENPHKILKTKVISNPFPDIIPRIQPKKKTTAEKQDDDRSKVKSAKNFNLLSFGEEAEEEEEINVNLSKTLSTKGKSSFDLNKDAVPAETTQDIEASCSSSDVNDNDDDDKKLQRKKEEAANYLSDGNGGEATTAAAAAVAPSEMLQKVKAKLKAAKDAKETTTTAAASSDHKSKESAAQDDEVIDFQEIIDDERKKIEMTKLNEFKKEYKQLKKSFIASNKTENIESTADSDKIHGKNPILKAYFDEMDKYKDKKGLKKSAEREQQVAAKLEAFKEKLAKATAAAQSSSELQDQKIPLATNKPQIDFLNDEDELDVDESQWLFNKFGELRDEEERQEQVNEAVNVHVKDEERYDMTDPRNPLNKRRRENKHKSDTTHSSGEKKRKH